MIGIPGICTVYPEILYCVHIFGMAIIFKNLKHSAVYRVELIPFSYFFLFISTKETGHAHKSVWYYL